VERGLGRALSSLPGPSFQIAVERGAAGEVGRVFQEPVPVLHWHASSVGNLASDRMGTSWRRMFPIAPSPFASSAPEGGELQLDHRHGSNWSPSCPLKSRLNLASAANFRFHVPCRACGDRGALACQWVDGNVAAIGARCATMASLRSGQRPSTVSSGPCSRVRSNGNERCDLRSRRRRAS
jgi:hypothetical protein